MIINKQKKINKIPKNIPKKKIYIPKNISKNIPNKIPKNYQIKYQNIFQIKYQKKIPNKIPKNILKYMEKKHIPNFIHTKKYAKYIFFFFK